MTDQREIPFTVASDLLRELGERLVGRQYIALAELVKNSYDADASRVEIRVENDCIEVSDNGHGMSQEHFEARWMHVGSTHKAQEKRSPELHRPLTGSKGIGRLAVQFLASEMELTSVPKESTVKKGGITEELLASVDWDVAVQAGDLTHATAQLQLTSPATTVFPLGKLHGTKVKLKKLKHQWDPDEFASLAREIWFLQPPFRSISGTNQGQNYGFDVSVLSADQKTVSSFESQMFRILDLYRSRIVGILESKEEPSKGAPSKEEPSKEQGKWKVELFLELERENTPTYEFEVPVKGDGPCLINALEFEIRIFNLQGRQDYGIPVRQARDYLREWGGVHIYDSGFRIPYAGAAADWLGLEVAHSHRLHVSQLLPPNLNVPNGLNDLPTNSRILGVVRIKTDPDPIVSSSIEEGSNQRLQIQVSRDRLVDNEAFQQLRDTVRFALDYYATRRAVLRVADKDASRPVVDPNLQVQDVWDVLEQHQDEIPEGVAERLRAELRKTVNSIREQAEWTKSQSGLLGAMATAGATAVALEHQFNQQLNVLEHHASVLEDLTKTDADMERSIGTITDSIKEWIKDARNTRAIFSPISDERNRTAVGRFKTRSLVENMASNLKPILRGVQVDVSGIDPELRLPEGSYPAWMAIFHNLFMNASNAMLDSERKEISVSSVRSGRRRGVRLQDTGTGISLNKAEDLFEPLKRALEISPERRALGYGGTGLGLAIVRMLATDMKMDVHFVEPEAPFNTCFEMTWSERE